MIYVTHDQVEAMTLADRIVVLNAGRIEQIGTPLDLYNRPANRFVAGFIGSPRMNFVEGVVRDNGQVALAHAGSALAGLATSDLAPGSPVTLGIRPEHIDIVAPDAADAKVRVDIVEQLGSESYLYGALADGTPVTLRQPDESPARRGDDVSIRFQRQRVHLFGVDGTAIGR
jgi:multiple sugar transport system ATP-binding protein